MALIPYVVERTQNGERSFDLYSRLLEDRIVMIDSEVRSDNMNIAVAELLYLNSKDSTRPIFLYINSPGGSVIDGQQLIDTMHFISAPVYTIALGMAASMGCAILAAGEKGHRYAMKSSQILAHPMSGGTGSGRTKDNVISMNYERKLEAYLIGQEGHDSGHISDKAWAEIQKVVGTLDINNQNMVIKFSNGTQKELDDYNKLCDYDHWMFPAEALKLGYIDQILESEKDLESIKG